jgi:NAD(P)-dependent dehydrogenase (short-subunit alcohol dehydrogenase family)
VNSVRPNWVARVNSVAFAANWVGRLVSLIGNHTTGTFLVSKAVAPHMIAQRSGVILNMNSVAGILGPSVCTAYSTAKAGIGMLTRVLGCEWGTYNVRVNAVIGLLSCLESPSVSS